MVKLFSLDGILATITLFVFNVIFIAKLDLGVKGWMLAVILSDFLSALFLFITARLHRFLSAKYFSRVLSKSMLRFAVPLIPTTVMWVITGLSDRMFIRYMHSDTVQLGEATAGIYGYAAKIPNLISMVSTIFFQAWNMSAITENESEDRNIFYEKVYDSYQSILFIASAFLIAGVQIVTPIFIDTTTYPEYASVYLYTPVLVVAVMFMCLNQFFGSIYTATKHTNNSFWTSLVACIVNIILNVTLIPRYAIQGASVATLLSYLVCYFIRLYDARRYVPFKVNIKNFTVSMVVLIALCIAVVTQPPYYPLYLAVGFLLVLVLNYKAIFVMAKNILKRK
jgi:O-antigen/teichoic acid export membrane protein